MWFFKSISSSPGSVAELFKALVTLRARVEALEENHEALKGQHTSLRGRVYALWGKEPPAAAAPPPVPAASSRDQLRAQLVASGRFTPGKPPVHQE